MARHGVSRYSKVWTTENTVGFNPELRRDQEGRYCMKLSHTPFKENENLAQNTCLYKIEIFAWD